MLDHTGSNATAGVGHNSSMPGDGHLAQFVSRIERLEEDKAAVAEDIKSIYAESKAIGYDPAIIRKVIAIRKEDKDKREQREEMIDLYLRELEKTDG